MMAGSGRVHAASIGELVGYSVEVTGPKKGKKWGGLSDPEMKRKKRVVKYKIYAMEGKVKASFRRGLRWFKNKVSVLVHGC